MVWGYGKRVETAFSVWCESLDVPPTCQKLWRCCLRFLTLYAIHLKLTRHEELWVLFALANDSLFDRVLWVTEVVYFFILYLRKVIVHQLLNLWGIMYSTCKNVFVLENLHMWVHIFEPVFSKLLNYTN